MNTTTSPNGMNLRFTILCIFGLMPILVPAQPIDNQQITKQIQAYKTDIRGPYRDIRWFCNDGEIRMPKDPCPDDPGGVQRARYKEEVIALGKKNHIFLGQILSNTDYAEFLDEANNYSQLKQYQLEKYLRAVDNGWILRKGQFYRGAIQVEDEEAWGIKFLEKTLARNDLIEKKFFLLRQAVRDLPHGKDDNRKQNIRAVSKIIADAYPDFMDLRVKIHSQPEAGDLPKVRAFRDTHRSKLNPELLKQFEQLISDMNKAYQPINLYTLNRLLPPIPAGSESRLSLISFINTYAEKPAGPEKTQAVANMIFDIRDFVSQIPDAKARLALLDISVLLEDILFSEVSTWEAKTLQESLDRIEALSRAAAGCGFLEKWEWEQLSEGFSPSEESQSVDIQTLLTLLESSRSVVEWGAGMTRANFQDVVSLFSGFEPLALGFQDDRIRSSVLLPLGREVGRLGDFIAVQANLSNQVLGISAQGQIRGLNPGFALGELVVVGETAGEVEVSADKIYIFQRPPADLKPVAGIATVNEGNMVSHVQLLARNLGIPNAVVSDQNLADLRKYSGKKVFYAVSNKGTVILKLADQMTAEEKKLFEVKQRSEEKIRVPVERMILSEAKILNLRNVKASDSGKLCGPKAANLGQLKVLFPENVVEGLVIPFSIFRQHMDQPMPGGQITYWNYVYDLFWEANEMTGMDCTDQEIETFTLQGLGKLREAIKQIPLKPEFVTELKEGFITAFAQPVGKVPVFLRSDTNMEDLKDFTGAGLNLTIFNAVEEQKILQGIRDVWASPYTERSYKWRQKYLLNPENVYPSILIIPSVDVDYSGVMITKGIVSNNPADITIAFSRGAGGAVDGQAAESYLLRANGKNQLLSPAREPGYNRLPATGGTRKNIATFEAPILNAQNLTAIRGLSAEVREKLPKTPGIETEGPFDVEFGFLNNKLWLFQVRPFVENKRAAASEYLLSITPQIPENKLVPLTTTF
ncbi:MAG: PEP/pyruvate-binding domain-containing protein [Bacteroidia bacterium]|nr:PEP/pyruvate-binding domain-containing protein [Bacteroidia bacterium]